jgi:hypothetical protein
MIKLNQSNETINQDHLNMKFLSESVFDIETF